MIRAWASFTRQNLKSLTPEQTTYWWLVSKGAAVRAKLAHMPPAVLAEPPEDY
jgi:hypothetical protein